MPLPSLESHTNDALLTEIRDLRGTECKTIAEIVLRLSEIDTRQIYRDAGYSSLFAYCTQCLGYPESSAGRRIEAARALRGNPEIYELLRDGKLSLCAIGTVAKVLTPDNSKEVLNLSQGRSKTEIQRIAAKYGPVESRPSRRETVRICRRQVEAPDLFTAKAPEPRVEERFSVTIELTAEELAIVEQARALVGHCRIKDVLVKSAREFVAKRSPKPRVKKVTPTVGVKSKTPVRSRYVPKAVQREVRERDGNRCTFVAPDGTRCAECRGLQFDHVQPFALGGGNGAENLRLVCASHNLLYAEQVFGRQRIQECAARSRSRSAGS